MLTTLLYSFKNCFENSNKWLTCLIDDFSSLWVNILVIWKFSFTPKTSESKSSFPAVINKKYKTVDGPWFYSHKIKIKFPEVFVSGDLHIFSSDHFIPFKIPLLMFDNFVWREQLVSCVECSGRLLYFRILSLFGLNVRIIFGSILQPKKVDLFLFHIESFGKI